MKRILVLLIGLLFSGTVCSQIQYRDSIYSDIAQSTHTYTIHQQDTLMFDYYRAIKAQGKLPLLIYVHGGGFMSGNRGGKGLRNFAHKLAGRGYAVASISYRLTMKNLGFGCETDAKAKKQAFDDASTDIDRAVKYLLDNPKEFEIDKTKIILVGSSAGAEAVLNTIYDFEHKELPEDFRYGGVISMAGALATLENINAETAVPTQLFHGTGDNLVPYDVASHHYCTAKQPGFMMLYGAGAISRKLRGLGKTYFLYTIYGGSHRWAGAPMEVFFNDMVDFLFNDVINPISNRQTERSMNDFEE